MASTTKQRVGYHKFWLLLNSICHIIFEKTSNSMSDSKVKIFNPEGHPSSAPSYSHISTIPISSTKKLVCFAGQTGTDHNTTPENAPSLYEQVQIAHKNVDKCLAAVGATKKDIVMNKQYVVKLASLSKEDFDARERAFLEWWKETEGEALPPPDTLCGVDSLWSKETLFEVEMMCVVNL